MGIKEVVGKIINRIIRPKQQALPSTTVSPPDRAGAFRKSHMTGSTIYTDGTKESLDDCILEYISQYKRQLESGESNNVSYKAFTRMFYEGQEEVGKNAGNQEKLKDKIGRNKKYRIDGQYSSKGKPIFYHISQNSIEGQRITDKDENMWKIYLNCERKDISRLTGELLKRLDKISNCAFRMKFIAESGEMQKSKRYQRNDKIVIYTQDSIDKERIINCITELKRQKPQLFSNRKKLPLMPKVNGFIGCVKQGKRAVSTPLYEVRGADTYNSKLATIMEDCMIFSIREISARDERIVREMEGYFGEDPEEYLKAFDIMDQNQVNQVVQMFKLQLIEYCEKSDLAIDKGSEPVNQPR